MRQLRQAPRPDCQWDKCADHLARVCIEFWNNGCKPKPLAVQVIMFKRLLAFTLTFFATLAWSDDSPAKVEGFTYVRTVGGIAEYKLDANGLQVLLLPVKTAPVATFMVTYHVGSRNEVTGTTGATHLLEHLMFKGSTKHDRSLGTGYDQVLERVGAETNATTWLDRTNYYSTVPMNALPLLIEVEAERMRNLSLREEDRRPEMTVVRNEFERGENKPMDALSKEIWAAAFQAHPYHHDTIGWRSDIERVPIEKLRAFYDTFYWPDNATATVIGDFDPAEALAAIREHYGAIPKSPHPLPQLYTEEPEQSGQRRVLLKRSGEIGIVALAHKIPQATHEDWPAIQVFSSILTYGKTSRCYRALTDKNLTIEVDGEARFTHDPSLHVTAAYLNNGVKHEDVERKLVAEIEKIKTSGVTAGEVQTAIAGFLARRAYARDGSFSLASELNECIAVGDWTLYASLEAKIKAVTPAEVQRVAKKYFIEDHSVAGWFVPVQTKSDDQPKDVSAKEEAFQPKEVLAPQPLATPLGDIPSADLAHRVARERVAGMDVLVCPGVAKDIVHVVISVPAGEAASSNRAVAHVVAGMLERGTKKHDQFAFADLLEKVGASIVSKIKIDTVEFSVKCLSKDMPLVISLLAEQLRTPAFLPEELAKLKKEMADSFQQTLESTDTQAAIAFSRAVFPKGHPSRQNTVPEMLADLEKVKLVDVRSFHAANYGPRDSHLIAVGDFDAAALQSETAKAFDGWKAQAERKQTTGTASDSPGGEVFFPMPDKASVTIIIGQPSGLSARDPDWLALNVGTKVLGEGFISRLIGNVRDREGLTYGIHAVMDDDSYRPGQWAIQGTFAPALLEKGIASTRRELEGWCKDGITADELAYRKSAMAGAFTISLETTEGLAERLLVCVERGFDIKWLDEFPAKINALTLNEVNAAIKKHLDPAKMVTVKAGTVK